LWIELQSVICRVDPNKFHIQIPLPPKIDPSVTMMTVEEKPDVTYNDVGGCKEQIEKMREVRIAFNFLMLFFILMYFFLW
jgi:ATP-dependent 26S proteasome regulatory subunit